jgi:predicted dehydrogenase
MVKIGIIGSGFGLYGLLPAFNSTPSCKVTSICGRKSDRLISYCKTIGLENIYTDWQRMLETENLDAVAIAVTPKAQYEIAKFAIKKGLHIFAEKPLSATHGQAKKLRSLASKNKIINAVDFIFPEIDQWKKVKEMIDKKTYGDLKEINVEWNFLSYDIKNNKTTWKSEISEGGGAVAFYFSHVLYYLEYFAGKISDLKGEIIYSKNKIETGVNMQIKFKNNITGLAQLSSNNPNMNFHKVILTFEKGKIILENHTGFVSGFTINIYKEGDPIKEIKSKSGNKNPNEDERVEVLRKVTKRFIDSIKNDKNFTPSFKEGERVQQLINEIRRQNVV